MVFLFIKNNLKEAFAIMKTLITFADPITGALSSVGSEHLVYTEGVGGSNPSAPTLSTKGCHF